MSRNNPIDDKPNYAKCRLFGKKPEVPVSLVVKELEERIDKWFESNEDESNLKLSSKLPPKKSSIKRSSRFDDLIYPKLATITEGNKDDFDEKVEAIRRNIHNENKYVFHDPIEEKEDDDFYYDEQWMIELKKEVDAVLNAPEPAQPKRSRMPFK